MRPQKLKPYIYHNKYEFRKWNNWELAHEPASSRKKNKKKKQKHQLVQLNIGLNMPTNVRHWLF